jgi:hypothetical protein
MNRHFPILMAAQAPLLKPASLIFGLLMWIVTTGTPQLSSAFDETTASGHLLRVADYLQAQRIAGCFFDINAEHFFQEHCRTIIRKVSAGIRNPGFA